MQEPPSNLSESYSVDPSVRHFRWRSFQPSPHEHGSHTRFQCLAFKCVSQCNAISFDTQKQTKN